MTALLNSVTDDLDKLNLYIGECYRLGINIVPPDINESKKDFAINTKGDIVFGFQGVKGLGNSAITSILNARKNGAFTSLTDFIQRASKVDKSNIQTLLKVGAFSNLEKNSKRWVNMLDYLQDAKNSKYYLEYDNLPRAIYTVVGTKQGKKSEKYKELVELKRELGGSKKDVEQKKVYTEKQEKLIDVYIESAEKHFLQYTVFSPKERMEFEQELLGFNISINPYKRWNDFKKFFISKQGNTTIPYIELNDLMNNGNKYFSLPKFHTVGILSDIKEIKTKKGNRMAKLTVEYFGTKTLITVFANKYENNLEFKLQKGNMVSIVGKLVETNKQFTDEDYEIRLDTIRQLNVLINENNKCIINLNDKNKDKVDQAVKTLANQERQDNLPIEKFVIYKMGDKYLVLNGLCWINNTEKLLNNL
jgi:DNA polymerase III alpha subunit